MAKSSPIAGGCHGVHMKMDKIEGPESHQEKSMNNDIKNHKCSRNVFGIE